MSEIYREQMLDHYHDPQNYGVLETPDIDIQLKTRPAGIRFI
jgi:NifU-like protein involved in Fe-S cluster formation